MSGQDEHRTTAMRAEILRSVTGRSTRSIAPRRADSLTNVMRGAGGRTRPTVR